MLRQIRSRLASRQRQRANAAIRKLCDDAEYLGIGPVPGPVRVALRTHHETQWKTWLVAIPLSIYIMRVIAGLLRDLTAEYAPHWTYEAIYETPEKPSLISAGYWLPTVHAAVLVTLAFLSIRRLMVGIANVYNLRALGFERVQRWADVISECAETVRAPHMRPDLQSIPLRLAVMRVRGARSMRGTVPSFSRRRTELRKHANQVVATLRATHAEIDVDRAEAARKLARLTLKISARYSQGYVGALLDDTDLVETTHRREALNLAILAGVMAVAGWGVQAFNVPPALGIGAVVFVGAWLYRSAASAGLAALAVLLPVLFPGK